MPGRPGDVPFRSPGSGGVGAEPPAQAVAAEHLGVEARTSGCPLNNVGYGTTIKACPWRATRVKAHEDRPLEEVAALGQAGDERAGGDVGNGDDGLRGSSFLASSS